ncbi:hypothetical protein GCM10023209_04980 [Roseibacterium beibuensis]|uniref:Uncharacterized protein n=1 Tax=[Roseibacterium] beibuensis TaxID=1193142 RepID=A0ABP9KYN1_9RHOB
MRVAGPDPNHLGVISRVGFSVLPAESFLEGRRVARAFTEVPPALGLHGRQGDTMGATITISGAQRESRRKRRVSRMIQASGLPVVAVMAKSRMPSAA